MTFSSLQQPTLSTFVRPYMVLIEQAGLLNICRNQGILFVSIV